VTRAWGGLRGALALALALSLDSTFPQRGRVLDLTFCVVEFSILVQGLTIKSLLKILRLASVTKVDVPPEGERLGLVCPTAPATHHSITSSNSRIRVGLYHSKYERLLLGYQKDRCAA